MVHEKKTQQKKWKRRKEIAKKKGQVKKSHREENHAKKWNLTACVSVCVSMYIVDGF